MRIHLPGAHWLCTLTPYRLSSWLASGTSHGREMNSTALASSGQRTFHEGYATKPALATEPSNSAFRENMAVSKVPVRITTVEIMRCSDLFRHFRRNVIIRPKTRGAPRIT